MKAHTTFDDPQPPFSVDVLHGSPDSDDDDDNPAARLAPPAREPPLESLLSASFRNEHGELEVATLSPGYLSAELGLRRLEVYRRWFWLLSSPALPRPLHECAVLGRQVRVTESMDRHLGLGRDGHLYLKPVPRVLLDVRFWRDFLPCDDDDGCCWGHGVGSAGRRLRRARHLERVPSVMAVAAAAGGGQGGEKREEEEEDEEDEGEDHKCEKRQLWECALGFLYSYAAILCHESDFAVARRHGLLPACVTWPRWRRLAAQLIAYPRVRDKVHPRFLYGELRLHRLDELAQLRPRPLYRRRGDGGGDGGWCGGCFFFWWPGGVLRVLAGRLDRLARFFQSNVRWLASLVAYIAIVLAALQTGLATSALAADAAFQAFAYGFTVFSLVGPLAVLLGFAVYFGAYVSYYLLMNLLAARREEREREKRRRRRRMGAHTVV